MQWKCRFYGHKWDLHIKDVNVVPALFSDRIIKLYDEYKCKECGIRKQENVRVL